MKNLIIILLAFFSFVTYCQVQIGQNIRLNDLYDSTTTVNYYSVKISDNGNIIAIAMPFSDNLLGVKSGIVKIYEYQNSQWVQIGKTIEGQFFDQGFGANIALSGDGKSILIGNSHENAPYLQVYSYISSNWIKVGSDIPATHWSTKNVLFTYEAYENILSISRDGKKIVFNDHIENTVNGIESGKIYFYELINNSWILHSNIIGKKRNERFGQILDYYITGHEIIGKFDNNHYNNSTSSQGFRLFRWQNNAWQQFGTDLDGFRDINISYAKNKNNESIVAVGDIDDFSNNQQLGSSGAVKVFKLTANGWLQIGQTIINDTRWVKTGGQVALSANGERLIVSVSDGNGTQIYDLKNNQWQLFGKGIDTNSFHGFSLSKNGNRLAIINNVINSTTNTLIGLDVIVYDITIPASTLYLNDDEKFKVFPNPVTNELNIVNLTKENLVSIKILDLNNRVIINQTSNITTIDTSYLTNGIYLLKIITENNTYYKKIIKKL